jgi:hypothetical protein
VLISRNRVEEVQGQEEIDGEHCLRRDTCIEYCVRVEKLAFGGIYGSTMCLEALLDLQKFIHKTQTERDKTFQVLDVLVLLCYQRLCCRDILATNVFKYRRSAFQIKPSQLPRHSPLPHPIPHGPTPTFQTPSGVHCHLNFHTHWP